MTRRRHWLVGTAAALSIVVVSVVWIVTRPQPNLSGEACKLILDRVGKVATVEELNAILGVPPGDYSKGNRGAIVDQVQIVHTPDEATAQMAMRLFLPGESSAKALQKLFLPRNDELQVDVWWGRSTSLTIVRDKSGELKAVVILPWIRPTPTGFIDKCEDWLYTRVYGKE